MNELTLALTLLSRSYGGNEKFANMIESEWVKSEHRKPAMRNYGPVKLWERNEIEYLLAAYETNTILQMAANLGRTYESVESTLTRMVKRGKLVRKRKARRVNMFNKLNSL